MTDEPIPQSTKPEWWKHPLPKAIGHEKNFVMTLPQMKVYEAVLKKMHDAVEKEWINVRRGAQALERRRLSPWVLAADPPRPVTLNRMLSFLVEEGNFHLLLLQTSSQLIASNTRKEHPCTADADTPATPGTTA